MRKILVLGTGGTISCAASEKGLVPAVSVSELLDGVGSGLPVELYTEQLFELDSTNMTARHWEALAKCIRERYDEFDGFVVTHGTDTMAYAAAFLSCLIQNSRKPVVFTGSMKPMLMKDSDASKNLAGAVRFAADERAFGVRVVFGGLIFDGRSVSKRESDFFLPFDSMNFDAPEEFDVNSGEIVFKEKYRGETWFYERLSDDVFLSKLVPGQALTVPEGARAVILEGYGLGGVPEYCMGEVERLFQKGVYIIIATQCRYGGTDLRRYEVGRTAAERFSLLETGKMTVEYAVARARWAMEYSNGFEEFREHFYDPDFSK